MANQKFEYIYYNPVEAGFVRDYKRGKGFLQIVQLKYLIIYISLPAQMDQPTRPQFHIWASKE